MKDATASNGVGPAQKVSFPSAEDVPLPPLIIRILSVADHAMKEKNVSVARKMIKQAYAYHDAASAIRDDCIEEEDISDADNERVCKAIHVLLRYWQL